MSLFSHCCLFAIFSFLQFAIVAGEPLTREIVSEFGFGNEEKVVLHQVLNALIHWEEHAGHGAFHFHGVKITDRSGKTARLAIILADIEIKRKQAISKICGRSANSPVTASGVPTQNPELMECYAANLRTAWEMAQLLDMLGVTIRQVPQMHREEDLLMHDFDAPVPNNAGSSPSQDGLATPTHGHPNHPRNVRGHAHRNIFETIDTFAKQEAEQNEAFGAEWTKHAEVIGVPKILSEVKIKHLQVQIDELKKANKAQEESQFFNMMMCMIAMASAEKEDPPKSDGILNSLGRGAAYYAKYPVMALGIMAEITSNGLERLYDWLDEKADPSGYDNDSCPTPGGMGEDIEAMINAGIFENLGGRGPGVGSTSGLNGLHDILSGAGGPRGAPQNLADLLNGERQNTGRGTGPFGSF